MCVIAVKPTDVDLPQEDKLKLMWDRNPDGAGYMYTLDNKVVITKGFMTFEDLKVSLALLNEELKVKEMTTKDIPMVMHFRITTHGGTSPENTHPFPITNEKEYLQALDVTCNMAMAHNGIISGLTNEVDISDTQVYIRDVLYDLSIVDKGFVDRFSTVISLTKGSSRLAFLDHEGQITMFGDFKTLTEDDGLKYSNTLFEKSKAVATYNSYYSYQETSPKAKITVFDEDEIYEVRDDIKLLDYLKKYIGHELYYIKTEYSGNYTSAATYINFLLDDGTTVYLNRAYIQLKNDTKLLELTNTKNNIGGRKNEETERIEQNANRLLYKKIDYTQLDLVRISTKYSLFANDDLLETLNFSDPVYSDDFCVENTTKKWFYNKTNEHYYYQQKDGSLIQISHKYMQYELLTDDSMNYIGFVKGFLYPEEITLLDITVYDIIDEKEV